DVGQLLRLRRVDDEIVVARVQADDLPAVDVYPRTQEELPALLQVEETVGVGLAAVLRDEHAVRAALERSRVRTVVLEVVVQDAGAARVGQELRAVADEPARRADVLEAHAPLAGGPHLLHAPAAPPELLDHRARVGLVDVDDHLLVRLLLLAAVTLLEDDLGLRDHELVAFAAHGLDQHGQV